MKYLYNRWVVFDNPFVQKVNIKIIKFQLFFLIIMVHKLEVKVCACVWLFISVTTEFATDP